MDECVSILILAKIISYITYFKIDISSVNGNQQKREIHKKKNKKKNSFIIHWNSIKAFHLNIKRNRFKI